MFLVVSDNGTIYPCDILFSLKPCKLALGKMSCIAFYNTYRLFQ